MRKIRDILRLRYEGGLTDGQITDPRLSNFDPASLQCRDGEEGAKCLTDVEVDIVKKWYGGQTETDKFVRLFMIPGAGHCWEPPHPSPDVFNPIEALENWVEHGIAPDRIDVAKHDSSGSIDLSSSFECSQLP